MMPLNGNALEKPTVNAAHKSEVRKLAQQLAGHSKGLSAAMKDQLQEIKEAIAMSGLGTERSKDAEKEVVAALKKIELKIDPLAGLSPPPSCRPCHGQTGGTHLFLCCAPPRKPSVIEQNIKDKVIDKLGHLFRAYKIAKVGPLPCAR